MQTVSLWQDTKTFFPLFVTELEKRSCRSVCVIGASDGKFVLPLAAAGYQVIAIERNSLALNGGDVVLPGGLPGTMVGLRQRLAIDRLAHMVEIVEADVLDVDGIRSCDAVWTSCSWHYSINHNRPLSDFIAKMHGFCGKSSGIVGAEFMMPVSPKHHEIEHYLGEGDIRRYFKGWNIVWEVYTPPFVEMPHVEQLEEHVHRMGFVVAQRA